jgi:hypothetical protein
MEFSIGADNMTGTVNSTFAGTPVVVDFALQKRNGFQIRAEAKQPVNLLKALSAVFPSGIPGSIKVPDYASMPAMTLTYRSSTGKVSISSGASSPDRDDLGN